jgi:hypothetical protein
VDMVNVSCLDRETTTCLPNSRALRSTAVSTLRSAVIVVFEICDDKFAVQKSMRCTLERSIYDVAEG